MYLMMDIEISCKGHCDSFSHFLYLKAAKGEGWAPPFISCAQDTVGL